ncbi:hypothetical protein GF413_00455 [Candidatus Micrarchaeota archaeon]|nr:hypothetical protein [Candidatus Micrarchaeota archaeon]
MPEVQVIFYKRTDGKVPINEWLENLTKKVRRKCLERVERLKEQGHELDRPFAAYLRDGLIKKTQKVPVNEIERAVERRRRFEEAPGSHTFLWET